MARATMAKTVQLRARVSFNGVVEGDVFTVDLNPKVQGWLDVGVVEVWSGEDQTGQGGAQPATDERVAGGAAGGVASSGEPGQGFGTGSYGASA